MLQSPEEGILGRLESGLGIRMTCSAMDSSSSGASSSVLLDTSVDSSSDEAAFRPNSRPRPETTLAKFIIQVIGASAAKYHQTVFSQSTQAKDSFLQQELSHLLLFVIYMLQSGRYYKVRRSKYFSSSFPARTSIKRLELHLKAIFRYET